jgi:hypothetical protein
MPLVHCVSYRTQTSRAVLADENPHRFPGVTGWSYEYLLKIGFRLVVHKLTQK